MTDMTIDPELAARNRRHGLFWGGVVLLVCALTAVKFIVLGGMPKDPRVSQVIEQRQGAAEAAARSVPAPEADRLPESRP